MNNTYVTIMAGGVGSRFWPGSREAKPKQFLDMLGVGKSLLRLTFERFLHLCPASNIFILTNAAYKDLILEHLPELTENQILCEPSRNNTAPCVAYSAFKIALLNPDANMIVAPSDHIILKEFTFIDLLKQALAYCEEKDALITLGIKPSRPDTGYGYIHFGKKIKGNVHKVKRFTEKPKLETAKEMVASGEYLWNAGIFIWSAKSIKKAFKDYAEDIYDLFERGQSVYNTPDESLFIEEWYPQSRSISIDFAVIEKADNVYCIPSDFGWSDLGTWASLYEEGEKDANNNFVLGENVVALDTHNCLIKSTKAGKLVVIKDMEDYLVIDEEDVLMIFPKHKEQEIKQLTSLVKSQFGEKYL